MNRLSSCRRAPFGGRGILVSAEDAVEMLHTAEAALEGNFSARATLLPEELPRPRDATPQDEFDHAGPDVLAKKPHQRARREIRHARNRFNPEALGEMRLNVGHGPAEGKIGRAHV